MYNNYNEQQEENVLEKYGRDITADAKAGKIDPVIAMFNAVAIMSQNPDVGTKEYNVFFV